MGWFDFLIKRAPADGGILGIVAGTGDLPMRVAGFAREKKHRLVVIAVGREEDDPLRELAAVYECFTIEQGQKAIEYLVREKVKRLVLTGKIQKMRLTQDDFNPDPVSREAVVKKSGGSGDNRILKAVAALLRVRGICVAGIGEYLDRDVTRGGVLSRRQPDERECNDVRVGLKAARAIGRMDIGQAVAVKNGSVVAVEAIEGTDRMLDRVKEMGIDGAVLVKTAKPQQDIRFDMPVIGAETIECAHAAGFSAVACEARKSLMVDFDACVAKADACKIALIGA